MKRKVELAEQNAQLVAVMEGMLQDKESIMESKESVIAVKEIIIKTSPWGADARLFSSHSNSMLRCPILALTCFGPRLPSNRLPALDGKSFFDWPDYLDRMDAVLLANFISGRFLRQGMP
jgi:hypothetical protein